VPELSGTFFLKIFDLKYEFIQTSSSFWIAQSKRKVMAFYKMN
jgi:hypothetical protein